MNKPGSGRLFANLFLALLLLLFIPEAEAQIKHRFVNPHADGPDTTLTRPSNWNDSHVLSGGSQGNFLMRDTGAGDGWSWFADCTASTGTLSCLNFAATGTGTGLITIKAGAAPSTPASGFGVLYEDSTSKNLVLKDDAGVVKHGVQTTTCTNQVATAISDAGVVTCANVSGAMIGKGATPTALTPGTAVSVDASLNTVFTLVPAQNFTLANPTNPTNGQRIVFRIKQDGTGSRIITLGTKYRFGADITTVVLSTAASKTDYLTVYYDSTDDKWDIVAFVKGY